MESSVNAQHDREKRRPRWRRVVGVAIMLMIGATFGVNMATQAPDNLGVRDGRLAPCPAKPNCVSTQAEDPAQRVPTGVLKLELGEAIKQIAVVLQQLPRTKVVKHEGEYWHVEFTSALFRYVDDLEIWIDDQSKLVHFRSASRIGYSDLGANRKRVNRLSALLVAADVIEPVAGQ